MAKTLSPNTTGVVNNGTLLQIGQNNTSSQWDYITLSKPTTPWRILIQGDLPTTSTTPDMSVSFYEGTTPLFSAVGTWQTQGQSSQSALKKNWKLKLKNPDTGNKLRVRIGNWEPMSSLTLKGYGTDRTLIRDSLSTALWREIRKHPSGTLMPESVFQYFDGTDLGTHMSSLFTTDGFPVEVWQNGAFLGLYVLRTNVDNTSFVMDTANNSHIQMQPQHAGNIWTYGFKSTEWCIYNPVISGYNPDDQSDISTIAPDINTACSRIVGWMSDCYNGKQDARATYHDYIDLKSFLDYVLLCEIAGSYDSMQNNFEMGSYNATTTTGIWYVWLYDCDETWGLVTGVNGSASDPENIGWVMLNPGNFGWQNPGFFSLMHKVFRPELRARWVELRRAKIVDPDVIIQWITNYAAKLDPDLMAADIANWKLDGATGSIDVGQNLYKESVGYIMNYVKTRIAWIDGQFGYFGS